MKVTPQTQQQAHDILKPFLENPGQYPDYEKAFQDETKERNNDKEREIKSDIWALPETKRTYYAVSSENEDPYLLIGINPSLGISSLGRVAKIGKRMGTCCFKYFFTNLLLPELKKRYPNRNCVTATAGTDKGKDFFNKLKSDPPSGVREITIKPNSNAFSIIISY